MFIVAILSALLCTIGACLVALFLKWIIAQVGVVIFAILLLSFSILFLLLGGLEDG